MERLLKPRFSEEAGVLCLLKAKDINRSVASKDKEQNQTQTLPESSENEFLFYLHGWEIEH